MFSNNFKKIVTSLAIILPLVSCGKTNENECFSIKLGYKCCKTCKVYDNDSDGVWGIEDNEWCGLKESCFIDTKCFSEPFFPCCKKDKVFFEDEYGEWGIENKQWCGIGQGNGKSLIISKNKDNDDKDSKNKQDTDDDDNDNKNAHDEIQERLDSLKEKLETLKNNTKNKQNTKDTKVETSLPKVNMTSWQYNETDDIYWQVGIFYCEKPADPNYESLGIFIPGKYFNATKNPDGKTYTCELNPSTKIDDYTVENAPMVIPVNTEGYMSSPSSQDYIDEAKRFTKRGIIYIGAGCRGRLEGAPYGVTDLKAAIRYLRYNDEILPGSTENIFALGFGSGGSQSILLGASGNSPLYDKYLKAIGAVEGVSDAIKGSMSWCPDVQLDTANAAYEWNMGSTRSGLTGETKALSNGLANAYADYINAIQFKNSRGEVLTLSPSKKGNYQSGSYYDYILEEIELSLNNFLNRTVFPYVQTPTVIYLNGNEFYGKDPLDEDDDKHGGPITIGDPIVYNTPEKYISSLNTSGKWVTYDSQAKKAKVTSLEGFVLRFKRAMKKVGAYDDYVEATRVENVLFGYGEDFLIGAHFDSTMAKLLKETEYAEAFTKDLKRKDALGSSVEERINMYNPLFFLDDYYSGYKTSEVAQFWRIQAGITQTENPLTTEYNLKLALENYGRTVDFESIWNIGHIKTEYEGNSTENFIQWIKECLN